jgi:hypothetical protein
MRRALTALIILLLRAVPAAGEADYTLRVQGEYRRDAVDFEEEAAEYHRERAALRFSRGSELSAAHVRNPGNGVSRGTWNLTLGDMSPHLSLTAGHFFVHFGKGLLAGKRSAYDPDVFTRRGDIHGGGVFTPCKSGNPLFAFHGLGASLDAGGDQFRVSLHSFYSIRERYISQEDYESRRTSSSLSTLESRDSRTGAYLEPAQVRTYGTMLTTTVLDLFSARAFYLSSGATTPPGDDITAGGLRGFSGRGFSLEYRDDCLSLFYETAITASRYMDDDGADADAAGRGYLAGTGLSIPFMKSSLIYKNMDAVYFSPYASTTGEYFGTGIFFDITLLPLKGLSLGASCSSERKTNTGSRDHDQAVSERERAFLSWAWRWIEDLRTDLAISRRSGEQSGDRRRFRQRLSLRPSRYFSIAASGTRQSCRGLDDSRLGTAAAGFHFRRACGIVFSYTRALVGEGNPVYESLVPLKNSSIPGSFIRDSGRLFACRATLAWRGLYFSTRLLEERCDDGRRNTLAEFFASGTL